MVGKLKDMAARSKGKGGDEDEDGESAFMPLEDVLRKLKAGPLNFGVYQTSDRDNPVLLAAHKRKNAAILGKQARKEAGTVKGAFGILSLDSDELTFRCENDDPPASLKKRVRVMLKNAGYAKFKPRILLPGGAELGDEDEDEGPDGAAPAPGAAPEGAGGGGQATGGAQASAPDDALKQDVEARWAEAEPVLSVLIDTADGKVSGQGAKLRKLMEISLQAGDFKKAKGALTVIEKFIENALADVGSDGAAGGGDTGGGSGSSPQQPVGGSAGPAAAPQAAGAATPPAATAGGQAGGAIPPEDNYHNGAPPVNAAENARLAALPPEQLAQMDLTIGDMDELFSEDYMMKLKDMEFKGEGDPKLKDLMKEVDKGLSGDRRLEVMQALSQIVGVPPTAEKLDVDYGRFLVVRSQQQAKGAPKGETVPPLDEDMHPDFLGSRSQLMFGKVLGDAFGIHEIFAALLSPTGGLVGPGNWLIPGVVKAGHLDPDNPVALHGTVHDAAGYLKTFHDDGPGYNYRDSPIEVLGPDSPLSGQVSGIYYWTKEVGMAFAERNFNELRAELEKQLGPAFNAVEAEIDKRMKEAKAAADKAAAEADKLAQAAGKTAAEVGEAIIEAPAKFEKSAVRVLESGAEKVGNLAESAQKELEAVWDFLGSLP
jgi:hypothetical protein